MLQATDTFDEHVGGVDAHKENGPRDPTFRSYTAEQAKAYALGRGTAYCPLLYSAVFSYHTEGGGQYQRLLDVGCGPGNATRDLAPSFCEAIGIDPSDAMIDNASDRGYKAKSGKEVLFQVRAGENLDEVDGIEPESVDVITSAMAAHWFVMPEFWKTAGKVLKPCGTVALWTCASIFAHPDTPNYEEVQRILNKLENETLAPYELPYNRLSKDLYTDLPLPWDCDPADNTFPKEDFVRKEWDRGGKCTDGKDFFGNKGDVTDLADLERGLSTASMVTRWREANPELVGTDKDCVKETINGLRKALGGQEKFITGKATVLLLFRKAGQSERD